MDNDYAYISANDDINKITTKATAYMKSEEVCDRIELKRSLDSIISQDFGIFCCLLGGRSTGKSLVLRDLIRRHTTSPSVLLIDLRDGYDIFTGLIISLRGHHAFNQSRFDESLRDVVDSLQGGGLPCASEQLPMVDFATTVSNTQTTHTPTPTTVLRYFLNTTDISYAYKLWLLLNKVVKHSLSTTSIFVDCLTIIIDDADLAFNTRTTTTSSSVSMYEERGSSASDVLSVFTRLTKQSREVSRSYSLLVIHNILRIVIYCVL